MIKIKNFLFIIIFIFLSISSLNAKDKVAYIDIDYILNNTLVGKSTLNSLKKDEELKINKYKSKDENFKIKENKILAKKNLVSNEEITKELKLLKVEFDKYRNRKIKEVEKLKVKRNRNIVNLLNQINPIIEKYMAENSIYMLIDKKNVFIANKNYDITKNLIELIDNQIKTIEIE